MANWVARWGLLSVAAVAAATAVVTQVRQRHAKRQGQSPPAGVEQPTLTNAEALTDR